MTGIDPNQIPVRYVVTSALGLFRDRTIVQVQSQQVVVAITAKLRQKKITGQSGYPLCPPGRKCGCWAGNSSVSRELRNLTGGKRAVVKPNLVDRAIHGVTPLVRVCSSYAHCPWIAAQVHRSSGGRPRSGAH